MTATVNTVQGPIPANQLGKTLFHEHFVFGYPGYQGDLTLGRYDRKEGRCIGIEIAEKAKGCGVKTVVDATPNECGRDPELLQEIAQATGLHIICATGYYFEKMSAPAYFKYRRGMGDIYSEIYEMFLAEITQGIGNTGIKAGIIKLASSEGVITDYEQQFFRAAAKAQRETGATIVTHTQQGTMGLEQAELLLAEGADPRRIVIGHMCGNTDIAYHLNLLQKGVFVGFDRFGIEGMVGANATTDATRQALIIGLIGAGYLNQLLLSHDTVNYWLGRKFNLPEKIERKREKWHVAHIFEDIIPNLLQAGITVEQIETLACRNPQQLFGA